MTGATSGIGAEALKNIAQSPDNKIYVGARGATCLTHWTK